MGWRPDIHRVHIWCKMLILHKFLLIILLHRYFFLGHCLHGWHLHQRLTKLIMHPSIWKKEWLLSLSLILYGCKFSHHLHLMNLVHLLNIIFSLLLELTLQHHFSLHLLLFKLLLLNFYLVELILVLAYHWVSFFILCCQIDDLWGQRPQVVRVIINVLILL